MVERLVYFSSLKSELQLLQYTRSFLAAKQALKAALSQLKFPSVFEALVALQRPTEFLLVCCVYFLEILVFELLRKLLDSYLDFFKCISFIYFLAFFPS